MTLPQTILRRAGVLMFGSDWAPRMADALDVNLRSVQRWTSGAQPIPTGVWGELASLADARGRMLAALTAELVARAVAADSVEGG